MSNKNQVGHNFVFISMRRPDATDVGLIGLLYFV